MTNLTNDVNLSALMTTLISVFAALLLLSQSGLQSIASAQDALPPILYQINPKIPALGRLFIILYLELDGPTLDSDGI